jgi:TolA-binding protein
MLDKARADLVARNYPAALRGAEAVLGSLTVPSAHRSAQLVAGEAAYGMGAYDRSAQHYGEFLSKNGRAAEAPQAALTLGWAQVRLRQPGRAQKTWTQISRVFPSDERAPLGLLLSAHAALQAGDASAARQWLDQLVKRYPASQEASVGRLSRSVLAVRTGREKDAGADVRELLRSGQMTCAAQERQTLVTGLATAGPEAPLMRVTGQRCQPMTAGSRSLEEFAAPFLDGTADPETTPAVLHALVRLGTEDRRWSEVGVLTMDLVNEYPSYPPTRALLTNVAGLAAADRQWPVVRGTYEQMLARDPASPLKTTARLDFAESLLRTGEPALAQAQLTQVASADRSREYVPRRLFLQGQVYEALGRPHEALAAYEELRRDHPRAEWTAESLLPRARMLQAVGQREKARTLLEHIVKGAQGDVYAEAAVRLGETLSAEGQHAQAVRWFLTTAYLNPDSTWGQRAQLGVLQGSLATGDRATADAVYRRMEHSDATDPDLLAKARAALDARTPSR